MNKVLLSFSIVIVFVYLMYPSYAAPSGFQKEQILIAHNNIRVALWLPILSWDSNLAEDARLWAEELAKNGKLEHSSPAARKYMWESLYYTKTTAKSVASHGGDAVSVWAGEEKYYNYKTNTCLSGYECGHYTQIIWKDTTHIWCGRAKRRDENGTTIYWVCRYNPAGNYRWVKPY